MGWSRRKLTKPNKKTDQEIWQSLEQSIYHGNYIFSSHAKKRLKDRSVTDIEVLDILENKPNRRRTVKSKDTYTYGHQDWSYCIEGYEIDGQKIRIIISFDSRLMLVITVIRISNSENQL
jgi:hypothetical protein